MAMVEPLAGIWHGLESCDNLRFNWMQLELVSRNAFFPDSDADPQQALLLAVFRGHRMCGYGRYQHTHPTHRSPTAGSTGFFFNTFMVAGVVGHYRFVEFWSQKA